MPPAMPYMSPYGSYAQYGLGPNPQMNPFDALAQSYQQQRQQLAQYLPQPQMQQTQQVQNPQQMPQMQSPLTIRAATNIDEVRATPIDIMSINFFFNQAQNEIYMSKIDDMGSKKIQTYKLLDGDAPPQPVQDGQVATPQIVAPELGSDIVAQLDRIETLLQPLARMKDADTSSKNAAKEVKEDV